jgi:hypothetical protein
MSDREPEIFEVAPTRIGGSRAAPGAGRSRRPTSVVVVLVIALAIPALAFVGPRIEWRPEVDLSFLRPTPTPPATPTPRPTRRPPQPTPTPLPNLLVEAGAPDRVPVDLDGIRLADTSDGDLGAPGPVRGDSAAVIAAPDGDGWWCVCFDRTWAQAGEHVVLVVRHVDGTGSAVVENPVGDRESSARPPAQDFSVRVDAEFSSDGTLAYLATATRAEDRWTLELEAIDVVSGRSLGRETLTTIDLPPPDAAAVNAGYESYLGGPSIRLSPDGSRLVVVSWVDHAPSPGLPAPAIVSSWLVDLTAPGDPDGPVATAEPMVGELGARSFACYFLAWLHDGALVGSCWNDGSSALSVSTFDPGGELASSIEYTPDPMWISEPLLDRATGTVWFWSPLGHSLDVVDLGRGTVGRSAVDPDATVIGRPPSRGGPLPAPDWGSFTSAYSPWDQTMLVPERHGTRLYAVGLEQAAGGAYRRGWGFGSTGVWVFDTATRALVDRWLPGAAYGSIGLTRDERYLLAVGQPGAAADGAPAGWDWSLNVHDTSDGRLVAQLGRLGNGSAVLLPP